MTGRFDISVKYPEVSASRVWIWCVYPRATPLWTPESWLVITGVQRQDQSSEGSALEMWQPWNAPDLHGSHIGTAEKIPKEWAAPAAPTQDCGASVNAIPLRDDVNRAASAAVAVMVTDDGSLVTAANHRKPLSAFGSGKAVVDAADAASEEEEDDNDEALCEGFGVPVVVGDPTAALDAMLTHERAEANANKAMASAKAKAVRKELRAAAAAARAAKAEAARIKETADADRCTADAVDAKRRLLVSVEAFVPLLMRHIVSTARSRFDADAAVAAAVASAAEKGAEATRWKQRCIAWGVRSQSLRVRRCHTLRRRPRVARFASSVSTPA